MTTCVASVLVDNTSLCPTFCGDCDSNGLGIDVLDALAAARIAAGVDTPSVAQTACCDTNSSSTVDVLDALQMAQAAAGLPAMPSCP